MVWYKHPSGGNALEHLPWAEKVITSGPDVMFIVEHGLKGYEDSFVIFASEFFNKKLAVYRVAKGSGELIASKVIDDTLDQAYSV